MSNFQDAIALIKEFSGQRNLISIPRVFIQFMGSIDGGLFLSQLVYWGDKGSRDDGWIWKSSNEWKDETCLTEYQVRKHTKKLKEMELLETKVKKAYGNPTVHYLFKYDKFSVSLLKFLSNETEIFKKPVTEPTTEPTTKDRGVKNSNFSETKSPLDPLSHIVASTGVKTGDDELWLQYRDAALKIFDTLSGAWGNTAAARATKKALIVEFANQQKNFDAERWKQAIKESIGSGVGAGNVNRFIEVYEAGGNYKAYIAQTYGKEEQTRITKDGTKRKTILKI